MPNISKLVASHPAAAAVHVAHGVATAFDVPSVRSANLPAGAPVTITPTSGYQGCVVLTPTASDPRTLEVALYVDKALTESGGVTWTPAAGSVIIDVPVGFNLGNGEAISYWIERSHLFHGTGGPLPTTGHP